MFPTRYDPIQKFGPSDCVSSINAIIDKIDQVLASGNREAVQQVKAVFGLGALTDDRDFAMTIAFPRTSPCNHLLDITSLGAR